MPRLMPDELIYRPEFYWEPSRKIARRICRFLLSHAFGDLSITAASVVASTAAKKLLVTAGETITAGMVVRLSTDDGLYYKADANLHTNASGISLHAALANQPLQIQTSGDITIGATTAIGTIYGLSVTAGGINLIAPGTPDLVAGGTMYPFIVGIGISTTKIRLIMKGVPFLVT